MPAALRIVFSAFALMLAMGTAAPAKDATSPEAAAKARAAELDEAFAAAMKAGQIGPSTVSLLKQAVVNLPNSYVYIPKAEGDRLMRAFGNRTGPQFLGLIMPREQPEWFATLNFADVGYVKEDDARDWKADELLTSLREGTEAANADRTARGFPAVEVTGWVEVPFYSPETHRLVWAANLRRKGQAEGGSVNYNTYALGRGGYIELNMIGSEAVINREKDRAKELLAALDYLPGKAYADFQSSTDKVASFGLAALVAGVAAKKLGMFALIGLGLAKFGKLIAIGGVALVAGIAKLRGHKQSS